MEVFELIKEIEITRTDGYGCLDEDTKIMYPVSESQKGRNVELE